MNSAILLICADMIAFSQYAPGYDEVGFAIDLTTSVGCRLRIPAKL
jgi:hypothetical protein